MLLHPKLLTRPTINLTTKTIIRMSSSLDPTAVAEFTELLKRSNRVLALCGAGLSVASGLDTFRGPGGMWRNYKAQELATPDAFDADPGLVWLFYSYRRHKALNAKPNPGHYALAELARRKEGFLCLTQNVDGLSPRANHPPDQLKLLHGSLFNIKCSECENYFQKENYDDPFHPLFAIDSPADTRLAAATQTANTLQPDPTYPIEPSFSSRQINPADLPHCPKCQGGLLRPGVVWFGEPLPQDTMQEIDDWVRQGKIDLILMIGTTAKVFPAAGYVSLARKHGARVAVINVDADDLGAATVRKGDFLFLGDSGKVLPEILKGVIGELKVLGKGE